MEFLDTVMNGDVAIRQEPLKRELIHLRQTSRLGQRQSLLTKEREGQPCFSCSSVRCAAARTSSEIVTAILP